MQDIDSLQHRSGLNTYVKFLEICSVTCSDISRIYQGATPCSPGPRSTTSITCARSHERERGIILVAEGLQLKNIKYPSYRVAPPVKGMLGFLANRK